MIHGPLLNISLNDSLQALCAMLVHSLWQGLLLTIAAGAVMLFTGNARAAVRYNWLIAFLIAFLVACGYTFVQAWNYVPVPAEPLATGTSPVAALLQEYGIAGWPAACARFCADHAAWIVTGWFIILCFKCWQIGRGMLYIRRIRKIGLQDPGAWWNGKLQTLAQQLQLQKTVRLLESGITRVPLVIGHLKPVIYMPLGLLANLPPEQVEAVLLHELAHIRRHDFLINWLQHIAETLFFFNPGLLWVSSLIKEEREHCCDDMALQHSRKKKPFIEALVSFKEHALSQSGYATAFPGKKSQLLQRVTRIIQNRNNPLTAPEKAFFVGSILIGALLLVAASHQQAPAHRAMPDREAYIAVMTAESLMDKQTVAKPENKPSAVAEYEYKKPKSNNTTVHKLPVSYSYYSAKEEPVPVSGEQQPAKYPSVEACKVPEPPAPIPPVEVVFAKQAIRDRKQAELDRAQADKDREQAAKDRAQAELDRKQAEKDRAQAELDRLQAVKDREQADRDRAQAEIDRRQAEKDRQQHFKDREQFERDRITYKQQLTAH